MNALLRVASKLKPALCLRFSKVGPGNGSRKDGGNFRSPSSRGECCWRGEFEWFHDRSREWELSLMIV